MARRDDVAAALELMQGGLRFCSYTTSGDERVLWRWNMGHCEHNGFKAELDAVRDFCQWYATVRTVKDEPQPAAFDIDAFMMDGIEALVKAAAEEMRARGDEFDAELAAGVMARAWHTVAIKCGWPW